MNTNRLETPTEPNERTSNQPRDSDDQQQLGVEMIAKVKQFAVEQPVAVVAAGLAIGVLTGLILKRK